MNDDLALREDDVFTFSISDEAIEAAAGNPLDADTQDTKMCYSCYECLTSTSFCEPRRTPPDRNPQVSRSTRHRR